MAKFDLTPEDTRDVFLEGLAEIDRVDCVSEHQNRNRRVFLLGRALAWGEIGGLEMPLYVHWHTRVHLPANLLSAPIVADIVAGLRARADLARGRWMVDIRTEARDLPQADVADLVREDIRRGELPNRLLFERGVLHTVTAQIDRIRARVGVDPAFDWRRVRLTLGVTGDDRGNLTSPVIRP